VLIPVVVYKAHRVGNWASPARAPRSH